MSGSSDRAGALSGLQISTAAVLKLMNTVASLTPDISPNLVSFRHPSERITPSLFGINHSKLSKSEGSGKSPTESKDGQAEEGAEGGIERLNLGRSLGSS